MMRQLIGFLDYRDFKSRTYLYEVWERIEAEGIVKNLFYDGTVKNWPSFAAEILRPGCLPFVISGDGKLAAFSWLNCITSRMARTHFCVFRSFYGRKRHVALSRHLYGYILSRKDGDGFLFDCLYGITPESNRLAINAARRSGWEIVGNLPCACYMAAENRSIGGIISCLTREKGTSWGETGAIWEE